MAKESPKPEAPKPEITLYGIMPVGGGLYRLVSRRVHPDSVKVESESDGYVPTMGRLVERVKR